MPGIDVDGIEEFESRFVKAANVEEEKKEQVPDDFIKVEVKLESITPSKEFALNPSEVDFEED